MLVHGQSSTSYIQHANPLHSHTIHASLSIFFSLTRLCFFYIPQPTMFSRKP